jgi:hypothetical protein
MSRKTGLIFLFSLVLSLTSFSELLPGYYVGSKGDSVFGKIEVHFTQDFADSLSYYELQYAVLFANKEGKVLLLKPSPLIKEIGIWQGGKWNKLICVKRKETVGSLKVRRTDYIFLYRGVHGPIDVYCVVLKRLWGWMEDDSDLCFFRKRKGKHVRETFNVSESQFEDLVSDCPEAIDYLKRNGALTQYQMMQLVLQFNKYCPE